MLPLRCWPAWDLHTVSVLFAVTCLEDTLKANFAASTQTVAPFSLAPSLVFYSWCFCSFDVATGPHLSTSSFSLYPASLLWCLSFLHHFLILLYECHSLLNLKLFISRITSGVWGSCFSSLILSGLRTVCIWGPAATSGMSPLVAFEHFSFGRVPPAVILRCSSSTSTP